MSQTSEQAVATEKKGRSSAAIWALVLTLGLGGGGWILWSFWNSLSISGHGAVVAVDEKPSERPGGAFGDMARYNRAERRAEQAAAAQAEINGPDYVRSYTNTNGGITYSGLDIKGGKTKLVIRQAGKAKQTLRVNASSVDPDFIPADVRLLLNIRLAMQNDLLTLEKMNLTAAQKTSLQGIPAGAWYAIDAAARKKAETLFNAWMDAPAVDKAAKEKDLIAFARELDSVEGPKTKKLAKERADQIKAIVTADQIKIFQQSAGR